MSREIRITLIHEVEGSLVISSPGGWEGAIFGLERNDYSSLTEYYKSGHSLYGTNGSENGGRDWAKNIEQVYGPDAIVQALIEIAEEDEPFETLFTGQLPIETAIEVLEFDHTLQMTFDPVSFWTTFKSRLDTPVQIFSTEDLDGGAVVPLVPFDVTLSPQIIETKALRTQSKILDSGYNTDTDGDYIDIQPYNPGSDKNFITIDLDTIELDEVENFYPSFLGASPELPPPILIPKYNSIISFNFNFPFTVKATVDSGGNKQTVSLADYDQDHLRFLADAAYMDWFIKIGNDPEIAFTKTFGESTGNGPFTDQYVIYTLALSNVVIQKNTAVRLYGKAYTTFGSNRLFTVTVFQLLLLGKINNTDLEWPFNPDGGDLQFALNNFQTKISIVAETTFEQTVSPALLIHDIAASIVQRITGVANSFKSEFLGRTNTLARTYAENGCGSPYINIKGLQLRGYTLEDKPPSMSMKQFWDCWNPVLNLGMGFKMLAGIPTIIIEDKAKFYDSTNVSVQLSNVRYIKKSWDESLIYKKAEFGYSNGQGQIASGLDDPQTKRTWATALKNIGTVLSMMSTGIAASLTIEQARRTTKQLSADYQYDNDDFIIKVVEDGATFKPETTEGYNSVTNLLNWETRYNKDITPTRNLIRWLNVACIGLQWVLSSFFKFVSGEGNYDMVVNKDDGCLGDYSNEDLSEKQNVQVVSDILHLPILYDIQHDLTYEQLKAIKANPEWAIEISQTESNYVKFFIKVLEWKQSDGTLKLSAYPTEYFNIQNIDTDVTEYETPNPPRAGIFDKSFDKPFN